MSNILEGLNPAQKAAVVNFEKPSLIIAGAGSGKTRVLTTRIAYMLEKGVSPISILALTFTNKAAAQMRERLEQMVGANLNRDIAMGTFHSIFSRIIRENAEMLGYPSSYTIFQPSDAKSLIKTILKELNISDEQYKPNSILSRISYAKNSLITPGAYAANADYVAEDREKRVPRFAEIYSIYCKRCKASGALDFDDLLLQTNILFRDFPEVLARYQKRFQYILVDEYQDTNYAQYIIIRRLAHHHSRVCVVGDDAQSIYSFRGAKIENILNFKKHFPEAETFKLEQNYRSTRTIVDAANSLIAHNKSKLDKRCFSDGEIGEKIRIMKAFTDRDEAQMIVEEMSYRHRREGASWGDMAILYRTNTQSQALEQALRQKAIPYKIHKGNSFYEQKEIKDMLAYVRVVINPRDDEAFKRIINYPTRGIGATTVERIAHLASERKCSMWEAIDHLVEESVSDPIQRAIVRKVKDFVDMIREISLQRVSMSLYDLGLFIANRSGMLPMYRLANTAESQSSISNIEELLNTMQLFNEQVEAEIRNGEREAEQIASIEEWLQSVMLLTDQDNGEEGEQEERVTLMTVHTSKGLEYEYIYIVGVEHNLFPSQRAMEMGEVEEERRLFYVAITRAKRAATISYCEMRFKWGNMEFTSPSSFLGDIDPQYLELIGDIIPKDLSVPRRKPAVIDGRYVSPRPSPDSKPATTPTQSRGERGRADEGAKKSAIEHLRKQFDYRHQSQKGAAPQSRPTVGMKSLGVRRTATEERVESGSKEGSTPISYRVGDQIEHDKFGVGRIVSVEEWRHGDMLRVNFVSVGEKSIVAKFAPIKKI